MRRVLVFVSATLLFACSYRAPAADAVSPATLSGQWGGEHVSLTLDGTRGTLQLDCAHGTITDLTIDAKGNLSAAGTFSHEHGGPIRKGEETQSEPARFSGHTDGKTMTLTILSASDSSQVIGEFSLQKGTEGRLYRCY